MVFVPASEKGDESDYTSLITITEKLTGLKIDTIKVTDYNAAVEAMRAGRAHIAWYGGKTYVKAAEIANAEAFAAGVRPGEKDAGYYTYFVVKNDSPLKKFPDRQMNLHAYDYAIFFKSILLNSLARVDTFHQ